MIKSKNNKKNTMEAKKEKIKNKAIEYSNINETEIVEEK